MNNTLGFINASQQTNKIMKRGSRRGGDTGAFSPCLLSICLPESRAFDHDSDGFSSPWRGRRSPGRLWATPGPAHLQHKWSELIVHMWGDGGHAHMAQCLQNMEIINLIELVKHHQCYERGFDWGSGFDKYRSEMFPWSFFSLGREPPRVYFW